MEQASPSPGSIPVTYIGAMTPESKPSLRVASWNIHKAVGTDLRRDTDRVLAGIAALQADIVALQEADKRLGARPSALPRDRIAELTGLVPLAIGRNAVSLGWHGNALLARPGIHLTGVEHLDLPGHEPRGAVIADLDTPNPLRVVCVHLGLLRSARRQQLDAIKAALNRHPTRPTVILGDFNEWSTRSGTEPLNGPFRVHVPGRSYPAGRPVAALDRIALSAGMHLLDAGTLSTPISRRASDHLPVWADVRAELPRHDTSWPEARISGAGLSSGPAQP